MTTRTALIATAAAAAIASAGFVQPAAAGGSVSYTYVPQTPKQAQMLSNGLRLYSMYQYSRANGGVINQQGLANSAGLSQSGSGNLGVIYQRGSNQAATLTQTGNNNTYGIFQFGNGGSANVAQTGNGQAGITIQRSW
jgi:curlin associated repeat protein